MADLLLLDLDGTLIDKAAGFHLWAEGFLQAVGRSNEDEVAWLVAVDGDGLTSREDLFVALQQRYALPEDVPTLVDTYLADFPELIPEPTPDTMTALRDARSAGYKLCILTNGGRRTQERKITSALASAVDGWAISEAIGVEKPDPA